LNLNFSRAFARVLLLLCFIPSVSYAHAADRSRDLPPRYRHWINEEVTYIIDSNEKKHFLSLTTDAERDSFIAEFWKIRNPDSDPTTNTYKEEHYRRLAYANEHFGSIDLQNGWRTDQGRIYITLGPPKQIINYPAARNVRPIEIWFYQSPSLALPTYFNVMFFKRSAGEPYTIYSPTSDGPAHLVASLEALNDQKRSLDILRKSLGDEVAKTAISLIPGESVDFDDYQPSLSSDMLLGEIAGLPDNPITQAGLAANRAREHVTVSVLNGDTDMSLGYEVFRDEQGRTTLSYLLSSHSPDLRLIGSGPDGSAYYDLSLRTEVTTPQGKEAYEQEDQLKGKLTPAEVEVAKKKRFSAEARVPLAPGAYVLVATLTNNITHISSRQHINVTVPDVDGKAIGISSLLAYTNPAAIPDPQNRLPFSASHFRFTPRGVQSVYLHQEEKLHLVFQLWFPPEAAGSQDKIHLRYVFGDPASHGKEPTVETEDVDASNLDKAGNFLTGHTVDTSGWGVGTYMLVVSAKRESAAQTAYASMTVHVLPPDDLANGWTAYGPADPEGVALDDLKRGMSAEAGGHDEGAEGWYLKALAESSTDVRPLGKLAALLKRHDQNQQLAALSKQPILTSSAIEPTPLLAIAGALKVVGDPKTEVAMLEAQMKLQAPTAELYQTLADAYGSIGNNAKANDLRSLAAKVK
jgi:GWxTD domain-containing protein